MKGRYIVIIWHQAGGLSGDQNNPVYYTWNDEATEAARVFDTVQEASKAWHEERMNELHAGFVVNVTDPKRINWL